LQRVTVYAVALFYLAAPFLLPLVSQMTISMLQALYYLWQPLTMLPMINNVAGPGSSIKKVIIN